MDPKSYPQQGGEYLEQNGSITPLGAPAEPEE